MYAIFIIIMILLNIGNINNILNLGDMMKVLNLYAGIGGNRKLWKNVEVTAIENNENIALAYQYFYPNDKVIITDAHKYLLEHFKEYDLCLLCIFWRNLIGFYGKVF